MKRILLYLLEIIIWLIVIYFIAQVTIMVFYPQVKEYKEYTVKMEDIDGLIVGSPVRLMGMLVGNVSKLKYSEDEIYLTIRITKKKINLPERTTLAIEGASLGGNRSIELTPGGDYLGINIKKQKRTVDMMKSANAAIEDMIKGYASMLSIVNSRTPDELDDKIAFFNNQLTSFDTLSYKVNTAIVDNLQKQPQQLRSIRTNVTTMVKTSSDPKIKESIQNFDKCIDSIQHNAKCMCDETQKLPVKTFYEQSEEINKQSRTVKEHKNKTQNAKSALDSINNASKGINSFAEMLNNFSQNIKSKEKKN